MAKYSERLVMKIVRLIEEDVYTITEICNALNISRKTFYEWRSEKAEFAQAIDEAMEIRDERLVEMAHSALKERLKETTIQEEIISYEVDNDNPSEFKVKSKLAKIRKVLPSIAVIRFVLDKDQRRREEKARIRRIEASKKPSGFRGFSSPFLEMYSE
ncbi:bacteriophage terminase small subunit [Dysgonomonas sp. Marseille-P4361]|uniref:bacteriophage terminase small subunit n=1 Tax=Dysgonomonas sp. Marseille-P4361 TaxID=2161820 RepID=UPI000D54F743|nr:bacteriophage terminase small subunit [Dysgonomonas sp. Marseille-P4361]